MVEESFAKKEEAPKQSAPPKPEPVKETPKFAGELSGLRAKPNCASNAGK